MRRYSVRECGLFYVFECTLLFGLFVLGVRSPVLYVLLFLTSLGGIVIAHIENR